MQERFALTLQSASISASATKTPVATAASEPIAHVAASAAARVISDTQLGNAFLASAAGVTQPALAANTHARTHAHAHKQPARSLCI